MSIASTINIVQFTQHPCCSWKLTKQHSCDNPITRHYKEGIMEVKLYDNVKVYRDGTSFTVTDGKSSFYIDYGHDNILIEGDGLDGDVVTIDDFEAYLQGIFCCTEAIPVENLPVYSLDGEENGFGCADDITNFSIIIVNTSEVAIPAGTIVLLEWSELGDNPVFSTEEEKAAIAIDGSFLALTADLDPEATLIFGVEFDNPECATEAVYTVTITAGEGYELSPDPFIISSPPID